MKKPTKQPDTGINSKLNGMSPVRLFYINTALLVTAVILLGLALWVQNIDKNPPIPFAGYSKGVTVTMGSVAIKINSVQTSVGKGHFKAPDGMHYLIVDLTVKNTSGKPLNVLPSTDTYVKSPAGKITNLSPFSLERPYRAGELLPGEQITGQLSYLVPKTGPQKLYVDALWSGGVIPFEL